MVKYQRAIAFEKIKNHKQQFSIKTNGNVELTYHIMNEISNKEIFSQMKPQMIENHNKILFRKQEQAIQLNHVAGNEKYEEELSYDFRKEVEKRYEDTERKKALLKQRFKLISKERTQQLHAIKLLTLTGVPQKNLHTQADLKSPQSSPMSPQIIHATKELSNLNENINYNPNSSRDYLYSTQEQEQDQEYGKEEQLEKILNIKDISPLQMLKLHVN